jgi:formiminotetrahydrofolate cyclodeaminase
MPVTTDLTVSGYVAQVAAGTPVPAGGSASALTGDLGVAIQLARAAAEGASLTAKTNLSSLSPDDEAESSRRRVQAEIEAVRALASASTAAVDHRPER